MDDFDMNETPKDPPFFIPESFLNQLFELTGLAESHKGFILAYVTEQGTPLVLTKTDSQIVELGLQEALQQYLEELTQREDIQFPPLESEE
jgi:hypothetical protein